MERWRLRADVETLVTAADGSKTERHLQFQRRWIADHKTSRDTSANGLNKPDKTDVNGDAHFDLTTNEVIVVNADGSRTETVRETNANGSLRDAWVKTTSADGLSKTTSLRSRRQCDDRSDDHGSRREERRRLLHDHDHEQ